AFVPSSSSAAAVDHEADEAATDAGECLYELAWREKVRERSASLHTAGAGPWLIVEDARGVGRALRSALEARGETCLTVSSPEDDVPVGLGGSARGVIDLRGLD